MISGDFSMTKKMLKRILCGMSFTCFMAQAIADRDIAAPVFSSYMAEHCNSRPYDCMDAKIVTAHLLNTFLYEFYLEVEDYFSQQGFDNSVFEYCIRNNDDLSPSLVPL